MNFEDFAPQERVNIVYRSETAHGAEEVELPLKVLFLSDMGLSDAPAFEDRKPIRVTRQTLADVMATQNVRAAFSVPNTVAPDSGHLPADLEFKTIQDFDPHRVAEQIPELQLLLKLREALSALKNPLNNRAEFRRALRQQVQDPKRRASLAKALLPSASQDTIEETE